MLVLDSELEGLHGSVAHAFQVSLNRPANDLADGDSRGQLGRFQALKHLFWEKEISALHVSYFIIRTAHNDAFGDQALLTPA